MRLMILTLLLLTANVAVAEELALHFTLPRGDEAALRCYLAVNAESGNTSRAFAFHPKSVDRSTRYVHPWSLTTETQADGNVIAGTISAETTVAVRGSSKAQTLTHSWTIHIDTKSMTVQAQAGEAEAVTTSLRVLEATPIGDDTLATLWPAWAVPHLNQKKDDGDFLGSDHVRNRGSIYGVPVITSPLRGQPVGYDGFYPGEIDIGSAPNSVPTALGPMPYKHNASYWRGRVLQSDLSIVDGQLRGSVNTDIRRGRKGRDFENCPLIGLYRYDIEATVIGNVVLGRYTSDKGESDERLIEPSGAIIGYLGRPSSRASEPLQPFAARAADEQGAVTPSSALFPGTHGISGQAGAYGPTRLWTSYVPQIASSEPVIYDFDAVAGAASYQAEVRASSADGFPVAVTLTDGRPTVDLSSIWEELSSSAYTLSLQALDADGAPLGEANTSYTIRRTPRFAGPYYESSFDRDDIRARLLAHCRWFRDSASVAPFRQSFLPGNIVAANGKNYANRPVVGGGVVSTMALLATLSEDPAERAEAIAAGEAAANWILARTGGPHDLPDFYYKSMFWYTLYTGHAYLDLYQVSGNERWREAALRLSRSYARLQHESGAWPFVFNNYGGGKVGVGMRRGWDGVDPRDAQWTVIGATDFLHWFGRVRTELETDDFREVETKAWNWVRDHDLQTFIWRRRGGYKAGQQTINNRYPSLLMQYLLDYADEGQVDDETLLRLWRHCEATAVNWRRDDSGERFLPHVHEYTAPRYTQEDPGATARYALIAAQLFQRSQDPVLRAKADALAGSCYANQDPAGLIHDLAKTEAPESIYTRFSDLQNTYPPHIAETGWMLWRLHQLMD